MMHTNTTQLDEFLDNNNKMSEHARYGEVSNALNKISLVLTISIAICSNLLQTLLEFRDVVNLYTQKYL